MVKRFSFWLEGIVEDDPIPVEIKIIVFKVTKNGEYKSTEMLGYEDINLTNKVPYFPLEAQFLWCHTLSKQNEQKFIYVIKNVIEEAFSSNILKQQFGGKEIYLQYKNIEFLFGV